MPIEIEPERTVPIPIARFDEPIALPLEDASPVAAELDKRGILVRHFANPALGLQRCLRVTIGLPEENERFLNELSDILEAK